MAIRESQFRKIALSFPLAHEKLSYGAPSIFVAKKFFARWRAEDASIVWIVDSVDERDTLIEMDPATYFVTEHYRNYPTVLVRAARIGEAMLKKVLERRWRMIAPRKLLKSDAAKLPPRRARAAG